MLNVENLFEGMHKNEQKWKKKKKRVVFSFKTLVMAKKSCPWKYFFFLFGFFFDFEYIDFLLSSRLVENVFRVKNAYKVE